MKTLKKLALVTAISAAPFMAQAELKMMDEASLSSTTGQAGVTIETSALVTIEQIVYQDQNTGTNFGTVQVDEISLTNTSGLAVSITQTVDVDSSGNLVVGISDVSNLRAQIADIKIGTAATAATVGGAVALTEDSIGSVRIDVGSITGLDQTISSGGAGGGDGLTIGLEAVQIDNVQVSYVDGAFVGADQAARIGASTITGNAAVISDLDIATTGTTTQNIDVVSHTTTSATGSIASGATVGALQITSTSTDIDLGIGDIAFATAAQYADTVAQGAGANRAASIGSMYVTGINMSGTVTKIYGH